MMCVIHDISFLCLGIPDPPGAFEISNISHDAVLLAWSPGFDGGLTQSFQLRVAKNEKDARTLSIPVNLTSYTLSGLSQGTAYQVSIAAKNALGESQYTLPIIFRTKSKSGFLNLKSINVLIANVIKY